MTGRDVDRFPDACTRRLNAGESYGFQNSFSLNAKRLARPRVSILRPGKAQTKKKNHQPHLRVVACMLLDPKFFFVRLRFPHAHCGR
jgi:hypothetical protein